MFEFIVLLSGIALGALVVLYFTRKSQNRNVRTEGHLLMESTRKIFKLAAVEGDFTEIYHKSESSSYFFELFSSEKKALIIVKARAILGFDLSTMVLDLNELNKTLTIRQFPPPQLISMDTDCQYYDLRNGTFNRFSPEDLTTMSNEAKDLIRKKIDTSKLPSMAIEQAKEAINLISGAALASGWKLIYNPALIGAQQPLLQSQNNG